MLARDLDFVQLCKVQPQLIPFFDEKSGRFQFHRQEALILLTETLINLDLGYTVPLVRDQLCPNYFNRLDYVLFIQTLLALTPHLLDEKPPIYGLDIGTSQSCIYPLICSKYIPNLKLMFATDIVLEFIEKAEENIALNGLKHIIKLILVNKDQNTYSHIARVCNTQIHFTMCNPPFYSSRAEMLLKSRKKQSFLKTEITGHHSELITEGGDYGFITKLISDSENVRDQVLWFTTLVGNHSTLVRIGSFLKSKNYSISFGVHRFQSGSYTTRWIIFWTYQTQFKPPIELFNYKSAKMSPKKIVKSLTSELTTPQLRFLLVRYLTSLPYDALNLRDTITVELPGNVFSRNYRRTRKLVSDGSTYIFEIRVSTRQVIWRTGFDYKIFETFVNVLNSLQ